MSREMKVVEWERVKWQEAFFFKGRFICPYCGEAIKLPKPWGICLTREEKKLPKDTLPGHTIHTCPSCNIPFLKPKWERKENATS